MIVESGLVNVVITADGSNLRLSVPRVETFYCGNKAWLEMGAGYPNYRCESCGAIGGSVAQPKNCFAPK